MFVYWQSGCVCAKVVVFGQSSCIRQGGCIWAKLFYSGKVVVLGQKWLYSVKSGCIRAKVVVLGQTWLYSGKIGCNLVKWMYSGKRG